jgi:histidine triad (HIT) family protein
MNDSIFTKIANKEIPAFIIDENDKFMAFLDIFPAYYGQTLVIPKDWHDAYIFNNDDEFIKEFMIYVKKIGKLLDEKLGSQRCIVMFEGFGVDHLHAKLYPSFQKESSGEEFNPRNKFEFSEEVGKEILSQISSRKILTDI